MSSHSPRIVRIQTLFLRRHTAHERRAAASLRRFWDAVILAANAKLKHVTSIPDVDVLLPEAEFERGFNLAMIPHWQAALLAGADIEQIAIGSQVQALAITIPEDIFVKLPGIAKTIARQFLRERTAGVWSQVRKTARLSLERAISTGINDGSGIYEIMRRINEKLRIGRNQSERIARTEVTAALNAGQYAIRSSEGIEQKLWISTIDNRTRTGEFNHAAADGQIVNNDDPFTVSGEKLLYPGDSSSASPGNTINCRCCATAYVEL